VSYYNFDAALKTKSSLSKVERDNLTGIATTSPIEFSWMNKYCRGFSVTVRASAHFMAPPFSPVVLYKNMCISLNSSCIFHSIIKYIEHMYREITFNLILKLTLKPMV
jgi:hypothetical protein